MNETHELQQLTLLPAPTVPARFRIDEVTRQRGIQHVNELRAQMAARRAARMAAAQQPVRQPIRPAA
ncbi:MAG TPA: hypothetical protein VMM60_18815 [Ilumatobacter sp.]|nr:hypothetical protein [Ilumatobacter sp.]